MPEKFMGASYPSGTGVSEAGGAVSPTVPVKGDAPTGMPYGWYRIEVTKEGETIPAKYNTETTLGACIAGATLGNGLKYNLLY